MSSHMLGAKDPASPVRPLADGDGLPSLPLTKQ